jgi:recombination protein RecA
VKKESVGGGKPKNRKSVATNLDSLYADIARETGGDVVGDLDTVTYYVDTGSLALNYSCSGRFMGGGIPGGRLTEIYGPSSSSKSLIGSNLLFATQKMGGIAVLLDVENAINKEFMKKASHVNIDQVLRFTPETLERCFHKMYIIIESIRKRDKNIPIVIVYDSLSVSPCERELREIQLPDKYTQADFKRIVKSNQQPGERARVCSTELRKLNTVMEKHNATVVILNQTREKIGVMYGNPETSGAGGNSLPFYASLRLRPQTQKKIEYTLVGKKKKCVGVNVKYKNVKNRSYRPFVEVEGVQLTFEKGINPISGLLFPMLDAARIKSVGKYYHVNPEYTDGQEVKFQSTIDANDVPLDVLLKCPKLIDAASREEVEVYLAPFMDAVNFLKSDGVSEVAVPGDQDDDAEEDMEDELEKALESDDPESSEE